MALSEQLLAMLVCPQCKGTLTVESTGDALLCGACRLRFPVRDDIPVLLVDEATPMAEG